MILVLLCLPFLMAAAMAMPQTARIRGWLDVTAGCCVLALALGMAVELPDPLPLLRNDRLGGFAAILVAAASLGRRASGALVGKHIATGGMLIAVLSAEPLLTAAGLALSVAAALQPRIAAAWHRIPLAGAGLGLLLFGSILPAVPLATGCVLFGLGTLGVAAPVLLPVLPLLALPYAGPELTVLGLAATIACGVALLFWPSAKALVPWGALGQASVVGVAFGLRTPDAMFAGLLLAALLVLAQAAYALADDKGLAPLLAGAGLAGLPPFGVFPGLVLTVAAVGKQAPWMLLVLLPGLAALGWAGILRLPAPHTVPSDRWSAAWIPFVAAVLIGWLLPDPIADWLRAIVRELNG